MYCCSIVRMTHRQTLPRVEAIRRLLAPVSIWNPVEQQRGAFRKPSGNLCYSADLEIGMCTVNVAQHIGPLNFDDEFAQVLVDH